MAEFFADCPQAPVSTRIVVEDVLSVSPDDNLNTALRRFTRRNIDEVPVLGSSKPHSLLDMLHCKETIAFYNQK